jgi:hypothetical protein
VDPRIPGFDAFFANVCFCVLYLDLVEVSALGRHQFLQSLLALRVCDFGHVTKGHNHCQQHNPSLRMMFGGLSFVFRLDYLSCVLTVASTILVGRRCWEGWALAGVNSVIMCVIGLRTEQLGFIPANIFCMVVSAINLRAWRRS